MLEIVFAEISNGFQALDGVGKELKRRRESTPSIWIGHGPRSKDEYTRKRFMSMVRSNKGQISSDKTLQIKDKFNRLADGWDSIHGLRYGSHVDRGSDDEDEGPTPHPYQWRFGPMLRLGFSAIGRSAIIRKGLDGTTHVLPAITVTASIADLLQTRSVDDFIHGKKTEYIALVVTRAHDATPMEVSFGSLQGKIAPFARYYMLEDGQWKIKTYDEMTKHKRGVLIYNK